MSYTFVGDRDGVYDRTSPIEMTQVNPQPVQPATEIQLPDIDDFSHITLHQAARDGKTDVIKQRLSKLASKNQARFQKLVNKRDEDNTTPLHYAVRYGQVEVVKLLVELGAVIDISGEDGASPLHYAARFRANLSRPSASRQVSQVIAGGENGTVPDGVVETNIGVVAAPLTHAISSNSLGEVNQAMSQVPSADESLIQFFVNECKGDVNVKDSYGSTPLHYAASKSNVTAIKELLKCDGINVDATDASGSTPLHCAATEGNVEIVEALLEAGSDSREKDYEGMTPIHFACTDGNPETVKLLFEYAERKGDLLDMLEDRNREGETALHSAVEGGYIDIVEICLKKGAKVKARRGNLAQPLHIAAINGYVDIAKLLVAHRAKIEARNANHETPLHKAAAFNKIFMVAFLLEKGADIDCLDKDNYTPLLVAASEGHTDVVSKLLREGADLQVKNIHDKTAIFLAAEENRVDTLKVILENENAKALINECDRYENTPLHVAAMNGYASVVQALLDNKAKINARNEDENTPLHLAAKNGKIRTVLELIKSDPTIINDEDEASNTALHLAAIEGHIKCCKALLEKGAEVDARNATLWTPLDCAAAKGHLKVANILLDYDSPVDPTDKTKTTPLHLAAKEGHAEMVTLLLSKGADITLTDLSGRNCLDLAADHSRKEAAMAIVNDEQWIDVLKNKSWEQSHVTTPLRKLIIKLPSVAEAVFNRCVKESNHHVEDKKYELTFYYEFLEDIYLDWSDGGDAASETSSVVSFSMEDVAEDEEFRKIQGSAGVAEAVTQLEKKDSHPLMIMVKNKREQLLGHPLVTFLLDYKWKTFGRYIYYFKLALYCLFLMFLTGYTVYLTEHGPVCANGTVVDRGTADESSVLYILWIRVGRIVILVLASMHILSELFQLVYQLRQYFSWENLLEWGVYVLAIVYVADEFQESLDTSCSTAKKTIGALSIFLAWMALVLFIRKFPKLGIYVVMFTSILYTFTKFFMIYVLFLVAFALSFFTLFYDPKQSVRGFGEPSRAIVKTAVMMIGEFDFDDLFNSPDQDVPGVAWFIFIVFLIIMTLILMNLLIGLAVDDIKGVQEQAVLERQAMLVDLAMDVEKALPRRLRKRLIPEREVVRPNQYEGFKGYWYSSPISAQEVQVALKPNKSSLEVLSDRTDELQETVLGMKNRLKTMQCNQEEIHKMLVGIVKKLDAIVEGDDDEDDQLF